jgi:hypothetical protein
MKEHFSQSGSIQELSLTQLREQIKKVMIPLLIKAVQSQMDLEDTEAYDQLLLLDRDLKNLQHWCQNCRSQIQIVLTPPTEEPRKFMINPDFLKAHPGIDKAWWKTLLRK